jgi:two-component sensor histidine kinase
MKILTDLSIKHKLTVIIMLTSTSALLLAGVVFLGYELITFRNTMIQNVAILAEIFGANCRAALVFNDRKSAEETLSALIAEPHVVSAALYAKTIQDPFATYFRDGAKAGVTYPSIENGHAFIGKFLFLSRPIRLNDKPIGAIYLQCDLKAMDERLQRYAGMVALVMLASASAAFLLASKLQPMISNPILHLVETAKTVSERKDYTVRASKKSKDELGLLVDSFNEMLDQIHQHEEVLHASLREKDVLLKEIHHRVKNNLQVISSLLNLQSGAITEPAVLAMFSESQNRIKSMALIHEKLYQSKDLAQIDFTEYVRNLTNHLYRSYAVNVNLIKLNFDVENIHLNIDTAIPCGLLLHELVSNALKYAFPNGQKGEIGVRLFRQEGDRLVLLVKDNGVGLPKDLDVKNSKSLGLKLVHILAQQLQGDLNYHSESGTEFSLAFSSKR